MTFVPGSTFLPRVLWRPALLFFAVAQVLLAFAPVLEATRGSSAVAHVEEAGTSLHHAHDEASCFACIAREILSSSELAGRSASEVPLSSGSILSADSGLPPSSGYGSVRSRAPPSVLA